MVHSMAVSLLLVTEQGSPAKTTAGSFTPQSEPEKPALHTQALYTVAPWLQQSPAPQSEAEPRPVPAIVRVEPLRVALVTAAVAAAVKEIEEADVVDSPELLVTVTVVVAAEQPPRAVVHTIWVDEAVTTAHCELHPSRVTVLSAAKLVPVTVTVAPPRVDAAAGAMLAITELHVTVEAEVA